MLSSLGHSVAEAANGRQALEMLDKDVYDVIVADLALPDMGGDDLAADAVKRQPDLRVIFATGYQALPKNERLEGLRTVILNKPYRESDIAEALKAAMSSPEARS
jgi:CheY-like chemotaxis protein